MSVKKNIKIISDVIKYENQWNEQYYFRIIIIIKYVVI